MNCPQAAPRVSVVMTVFNQARYCRAAIDSIAGQTLADLELIIVDDGSTDETAAFVDTCAAADGRIRAIHTGNEGIAAARNLGIALARADLVALMDGDDISLPHRLEKQASFLDRHPQIGVVGSWMNVVDAKGTIVRLARYPTHPHAVQATILKGCPIGCPSSMIRRTLALQAGGFRTIFRVAEDYDFWLRLSEHTDLANLDDVLVNYRAHGQNATKRFRNRQAFEGHIARLAARIRRQDRPDPLDQLDRIDKATLDLFDLEVYKRVELLRLWVKAQVEMQATDAREPGAARPLL